LWSIYYGSSRNEFIVVSQVEIWKSLSSFVQQQKSFFFPPPPPFVIKPTRCTNFTNLFCHETLHVSDRSSVYHQEFINCTLSNGICHTVCRQLPSRTRVELSSILVLLGSCLQTCMTYNIAECTVNKLLIMDRRTVRNM